VRENEQKQEHTGSYYAATANEDTDYPVLEGAISADVGADYDQMIWNLKWRGNDIVYDRGEKCGLGCDLTGGSL